MNTSTSPYKSSRSRFKKVKIKIALVKAYIVIHQQDTWKYIFKSNYRE